MTEIKRKDRLEGRTETEMESIVRQVNKSISNLVDDVNTEIKKGWNGEILISSESTVKITVQQGKIIKVEQS